MHNVTLSLDHKQLSQEYLLVAAWKKAHDFIRHHNWYSDVLALDLANASLKQILESFRQDLSDDELKPEELRLVVAPKTQKWKINQETWEPEEDLASKIRPLAHLSIRDQVIGTALMILLADRVETEQGDPRQSFEKANATGMVSYGHRLFCDVGEGQLIYRWGNSNVYRQYFQDYEAFIRRPEKIVELKFKAEDSSWAIVSADLSQFYDRIRPELLSEKLKRFTLDADPELQKCYSTFFDWRWGESDGNDASKYGENSVPPIEGFDRIALPQGLVAAGFFSNVILLDFDRDIVGMFGASMGDWELVDYCRYVDDMRFVVRLSDEFQTKDPATQENEIKSTFVRILNQKLGILAAGLLVKAEKTEVVLGASASGSVRYASAMKRINENVSGVVDVALGSETLDLIEGLFCSADSEPLKLGKRFQGTALDTEPDVREETVSRFAANRFRRLFRLVRPMLDGSDAEDSSDNLTLSGQKGLTQKSLDVKALHFSGILIERWVQNPASMRLLRVALDLNPSVENLNLVLGLLKDHLGSEERERRLVACYCAAELLKAGATETGLVDDADKLPCTANLPEYQKTLKGFAIEIVSGEAEFPWYLKQQAQLFLACFGESETPPGVEQVDPSESHYALLRQVVARNYANVPDEQVSAYACLHSKLRDHRAAASGYFVRFRDQPTSVQRKWLIQILEEQRPLAAAIWEIMDEEQQRLWHSLFEDHGVLASLLNATEPLQPERMTPFLHVACVKNNPFQHEYALLALAKKLIPMLVSNGETIVPSHLLISSDDWGLLESKNYPISENAFELKLVGRLADDARYRLPDWVNPDLSWAYTLGMLLRVVLTGNPDYTQQNFNRPYSGVVKYRPYRSSWLRRRYGLFNGRSAFGPPWLPVTNWVSDLLTRLLRWPGFPKVSRSEIPEINAPQQIVELLTARLKYLESMYGNGIQTSLLPLQIHKKGESPLVASLFKKPVNMRVAVAQTVLPRLGHFAGDVTLDNPKTRRKHRRHTASVLSAVDRMLEVRSTHIESKNEVELLVLPELSVHPNDISTLVKPFVRRNRCAVCTGLVFHKAEESDTRLINVAAWFIPTYSPAGGASVEVVFQGKENLTQLELNSGISPFRPAQWIFEVIDPTFSNYAWWKMTSAVCYDATDLKLASDLRDYSDMFIVPALNKDVGTFDNMAAALHYHMFQHVVVANTGEFGGSSAHAPFKDPHSRTMFHSHGSEQVSIGFFDVDINQYRRNPELFKTPPANFRK